MKIVKGKIKFDFTDWEMGSWDIRKMFKLSWCETSESVEIEFDSDKMDKIYADGLAELLHSFFQPDNLVTMDFTTKGIAWMCESGLEKPVVVPYPMVTLLLSEAQRVELIRLLQSMGTAEECVNLETLQRLARKSAVR